MRFSPEGPLPWFDDVDGTRRSLGTEHATKTKRTWFSRKELPVLGVAPTGHSIHDIQLIAFHKSGLGVNVLLTSMRAVILMDGTIFLNQQVDHKFAQGVQD